MGFRTQIPEDRLLGGACYKTWGGAEDENVSKQVRPARNSCSKWVGRSDIRLPVSNAAHNILPAGGRGLSVDTTATFWLYVNCRRDSYACNGRRAMLPSE